MRGYNVSPANFDEAAIAVTLTLVVCGLVIWLGYSLFNRHK